MVYEAIDGNGRFRRDSHLAGQLHGAVGSVMANIAEGLMRRSDKEFSQFLYTALASAAEVQSHLYVALDVGYVSEEKFKNLYSQAGQTSKLISGLIKYLRSPKTEQTKQTEQTQ